MTTKPSEVVKSAVELAKTICGDAWERALVDYSVADAMEDLRVYTAEQDDVMIRATLERMEESLTDFARYVLVPENAVVGEGVTALGYSDRYAYTIVAKTAKTITIQRDIATMDPNFKPNFIPGGFAGHCENQSEQTYTYEQDPDGAKLKAYWSERDGVYKVNGMKLRKGRREFYDYNF